MINIIDEIIELLDSRDKKYKTKISYLLNSLHNLPKVYLNPEAKTLFNIGIQPINSDDAMEYAEFYLKLINNIN
jgi:hypothetical protein